MSTISKHRMARLYIATGTSKYREGSGLSQLPSVLENLALLKGTLEGVGYKSALPGLSANPSFEQLNELTQWFQSAARAANDEVILYYSGHGYVEDRHYLVLASGQSFPTEDLFRAVAAKPMVRSCLIILDTCQSGAVGLDIGRIFASFEERLEQAGAHITILTSSRTRQEAQENAFTPAFCKQLRNENRIAGLNLKLLKYSEVIEGIRPSLPAWQQTKSITKPETDSGESPFCFPNCLYRPDMPENLDLETQRRIVERKTHWDDRSRYFTGRARAIQEIQEWLRQPTSNGRARVVTGSPGAGKSALLSQFADVASPALIRFRFMPEARI